MKYHFIGIKGSGMSSLAQVLHDLGNNVQGSDIPEYIFTQEGLEERNISVLPFTKNNIDVGQIVIAGSSFNSKHEEVEKSKKIGVAMYKYNEFLGEFIKIFNSIAVTGTHGKTSITGMLSHVFNSVKPTNYLIGDGTGKGFSSATDFIFEACEYKSHFLSYRPKLAIINNIDFDHPDYFDNIDSVRKVFYDFAEGIEERLFANGDDQEIRKIEIEKPITYFGFSKSNNVFAQDILIEHSGLSFDVYINSEFHHRFHIKSFGNHSVMNALAVISVCQYKGIEPSLIQAAFNKYKGVKRRFDEIKLNEQIIIDDYAHHPTEINATIEAVRQKYPEKQLVAIFQPHTESRTVKFLKEFSESLSKADSVYLCDVFKSAREINGNNNINQLKKQIDNVKSLNTSNLELLTRHKDSVLLFMGAGDIQKYRNSYLNLV